MQWWAPSSPHDRPHPPALQIINFVSIHHFVWRFTETFFNLFFFVPPIGENHSSFIRLEMAQE